jgi:hypothetical protein
MPSSVPIGLTLDPKTLALAEAVKAFVVAQSSGTPLTCRGPTAMLDGRAMLTVLGYKEVDCSALSDALRSEFGVPLPVMAQGLTRGLGQFAIKITVPRATPIPSKRVMSACQRATALLSALLLLGCAAILHR